MRKMRHPTAPWSRSSMRIHPPLNNQIINVNMEQVDYDRDTDNDDDLDDEEQPLAGNPMPKAMPHPKLVPKSPPTTLRLMSKMKPAPNNILDEETESDNHPGDRPALPRRPAMRPTLTTNDRWSGILSSSISCTNTTRSAQPSSRRTLNSTSSLSMNDNMEPGYSG